MKKWNCTLCLLLALLTPIFAQETAKKGDKNTDPNSGIYVDGNIGLMVLNGDDFHGEFSVSSGYRFNDKVGIGLSYLTTGVQTVSTSRGMKGIGIQTRITMGRFLMRLDVGKLLDVSHGTDWFCNDTYQPKFDVYFRPSVGIRLKGIVLGISSTTTGLMDFLEYDAEVSAEYPDICNGQQKQWAIHTFVLTAGIALPTFKKEAE